MNKLLVVVDMQNDFIDGVLGSPEAQAIVPKVVKRIEQAIEDKETIAFTQDTHLSLSYEYSEEGKNLPIPHCIFPGKGWRLHSDIKKYAEDSQIYWKYTFGHDWKELYYNTYNQIEIIGLDTDFCVLANAMTLKTAFPAAHIVINAACCAGSTPEWHEKALDMLEHCHCEIINREESKQ